MLCGPRQCSRFCGCGGSCAPVLGLLLPTPWGNSSFWCWILSSYSCELLPALPLPSCLEVVVPSSLWERQWVGSIPYGGCICSVTPLRRAAQLFVTAAFCFYHRSPCWARKYPNETFHPFLAS